MANYLSIEKRIHVFHLLCEGNGINSITRIVGCAKHTVSLLQTRYSSIVDYLNKKLITDLDIAEIEADEIRTFILKKNNIRWVYIAMDRESRFVIHFHIGKRDANDAKVFLSGLSNKLNTKSQVSTDCLKSYVTAVSKTPYGRTEAATNSIGLLRANDPHKKLKRSITNRIESHNGNVRQHVSRLIRRTRCFSKSEEKLIQHLNLFFFYYNFIKKHKALKTTPSVSASISDIPFTFDILIDYDNMFTGSPTERRLYTHHSNLHKKGAKIAKIDKKFILKVEDDFKLEKIQEKSRERWKKIINQ